MMALCRCGHEQYLHCDWHDNCLICGCPEYRQAETPNYHSDTPE